MKILYILLISFTSLFSSVSCKYKIESNSLYQFSRHENSNILSVQGEVDDGLVYGGLDPANSSIVYYDNNSAVCGGKNLSNIVITAYCPYDIDICWDITLGASGYQTIINKDDRYLNNVVIVNSIPCLPREVSKLTVGYYDYDNNDIGFATLNLLAIEEEREFLVTPAQARTQREQCPNLIQYVDEWEELLTNQTISLEKNLNSIDIFNYNNIDSTLQNISNTLQNYTSNNANENNDNNNSNDENFDGITDNFTINKNIDLELNDFKAEIESSLSNSFDTYSNIFGFNNYAIAPEPITFNLLGNTYSAFDVTLYDEHIPFIRNTFISFAYIWGFILVVRDLA